MSRRNSIIGAAMGLSAASAGAVLIADRKVGAARRAGQASQALLQPPAPDRVGTVPTSDGVPLYYEDNGPADAAVTVVGVHGFCLNRDDFLFQRRAVIEAYGTQARFLGYDHRSHGRSGRGAPHTATIDQLGEDLKTILDELVPSGRAILIGHSMGGMTIMALADRHPELFAADGKVAAVMLLDTSTGKMGEITLGLPAVLARGGVVLPSVLKGMQRRKTLVEASRAQAGDILWVFIRRIAFGGPVDPGLTELVAQMIAETPVDVIGDFYPALINHDKLRALQNLRDTKVVIVCGERDVVTPPSHSREMADSLPSAELVMIPGAGHQAMMERPELVNGPLLDLVDAALTSAPPRRRRLRTRRS